MQWSEESKSCGPYVFVAEEVRGRYRTRGRNISYKPYRRKRSIIPLSKAVNVLEKEIKLMNNVLDKHCEQMSLMYNMLMTLERKNELMENVMQHITSAVGQRGDE